MTVFVPHQSMVLLIQCLFLRFIYVSNMLKGEVIAFTRNQDDTLTAVQVSILLFGSIKMSIVVTRHMHVHVHKHNRAFLACAKSL